MQKGRLEAFSDGVLAIIITIITINGLDRSVYNLFIIRLFVFKAHNGEVTQQTNKVKSGGVSQRCYGPIIIFLFLFNLKSSCNDYQFPFQVI